MTIYSLDIIPSLEPVCCSIPVLSVASWPVYRFLRRQVRWSSILTSLRIFQFVVIHTVKGFGIVNKTEVDVFLEFSCFFYDPWNSPGQNTGVGSLSLLKGIFPTQESNPGLLHSGRFFTSWATREAHKKSKGKPNASASRTLNHIRNTWESC